MDLQKLEADLGELEQKFRERNGLAWRMSEPTARKIGRDGYTKEDYDRELATLKSQLDAIYDPRNSIRPVLNDVVAAYPAVSEEERAAIRDIFQRSSCGSYGLLDYILECAECLETPEDVDIFRLALVAASIQNCAQDFRDTSAVLAELAMAAVKARIDIQPHCTEIAELSSAEQPNGSCQPMKSVLAEFHIYAPKAVRHF